MITTLVATTAAGCSSSTSENAGSKDTNTQKKAQEVRIAFLSEPDTLDPSLATSEESFNMINMYSEGLYRMDKDNKPQPAMAADLPQISADGKKYTIKLRDGIKWSDGTPVTAKDFEYSWKRTTDPKTKSEYAFMFTMWIKGAEAYNGGKGKAEDMAVKAVDDKTLEFELNYPVAFFTSQLAFPLFFPEHQEFVEKQGDKKYAADADKMLANGPFLLKNWTHDQSLEFVKNDKYWDAANVKLDKATYQIITDTNTALNLYESGDIDIIEITRDQVPQWKDKPDFSVSPRLFTYDLRFNEKFPAFKNAKVRQALTMAVDRQAFVDTVLGNGSKPAAGYVPAGTANGNNEDFRTVNGDTQPKYDLDQAKKLLADGLKELGMDKMPKFTMLSDDDDTAKKSVQFIQGAFKQGLGIDADVQPMPKKLRLEKQTNGDFDMIAPSRWGADYNDPATFLDQWVTGSSFNTIGYSNPEYDKLVNGAHNEADAKKRADMLAQGEKILMKDMPIGPLYYLSRSYLKRPSIDGLIFMPMNGQYELKWASIK